eukprot:m.872769 g.872769  ORF g.872769 m.872769 type:complete len:53 (+) comp23572_c1_seq3:979-1137(+)
MHEFLISTLHSVQIFGKTGASLSKQMESATGMHLMYFDAYFRCSTSSNSGAM